MNAHSLFAAMSPALAEKILYFFRDEDRDIYKSTVASLAVQRNLRPIFVSQKPKTWQISWLLKTLKLRSCDEIAGNLLQVWLMKERQDMLTTFLDGLGIAHDGEGSIEDELPEELDPKKLGEAIDGLCAKYPPEEVALYLHAFQMQTDEGWTELNAMLESDERLKLGA